MRRTLAGVCAVLLLVGECLFACEKQPVHFQAAAMLHRIVNRTQMPISQDSHAGDVFRRAGVGRKRVRPP